MTPLVLLISITVGVVLTFSASEVARFRAVRSGRAYDYSRVGVGCIAAVLTGFLVLAAFISSLFLGDAGVLMTVAALAVALVLFFPWKSV